MKNLWQNTSLIKNYLKKHDRLMIFFDFDGTLAPISPTWELARLRDKTGSLLKKLVKNQNIHPVFVSGRSLDDVKRKIGIPGITVSGNHGLEWESDSIYKSNADLNSIKPIFTRIKRHLDKLKSRYNGVLIEDKNMTLAVHFRLLKETDIEAFLTEIKEILTNYRKEKIKYAFGNKVIDIIPDAGFNKGSFCRYLINEQKAKLNKPFGVFYLGDDTTDEDAFKILKHAITIRVGNTDVSEAKFYLNNQNEVIKFLDLINRFYS